ncbi:hypothetical protein HPB49_024937 [Dermacentor silvarum]|uniref:Uncharacterized protein n=1 Tax=Dermacentor silvarum TaxID=543639 RepID=A0ACB8CNM1_DERSI|nr:hypothetical protein HPB49_024937 [Dermacentor silvarum]
MCSKSSLMVYRKHKSEISKERLYDNNGGSGVLFEVGAGALRTLLCRRRFDDSTEVTSASCRVCEKEEETIDHLVFLCAYLCPRQREGTTLPPALGLAGPSVAVHEQEGGEVAGAVNYAVVRITKARLGQWWRTTQR